MHPIAADTHEAQVIREYRDREVAFFNNLPTAQRALLRAHHIDPADSLLYGELAFVLVGLKPCVLIDFPRDASASTSITHLYRQAVLDPLKEQYDICINEIHRPLASDEMELKGCLLVHKSCPLVQQLLDQQDEQVSETLLAKLLDYPGRLPESSDEISTMCEVVYYAIPSKVILTTFAAQQDELDQVKAHFARYKEQCHTQLGMELGLLVRRPGF
ncbi:hypothetical protein O0I10_005864 [Lichtheimia ornata]|uniref:Uncharacterized protein n=1 Tax=Lichtheimia ornata TaxID=688661 RepID=A0AAD7V6G9_9FUNG|nr:uncharacterized protein O0I10_005864 [Lichtheimia ornata]KAJ8658511.1 hypothetical protein O0I10_005864 [Lichtheimia ornata]